jgi:hypothetical protein
MRVRATMPGYYCNVFINAGEVFDLLQNPDGTDPVRQVRKKKPDGKFEVVDFLDRDGNKVHRDFAEDTGQYLIEDGPMAGETAYLGWMEEVGEDVPCTIVGIEQYRHGFDVMTRRPRQPPLPPRVKAPVQQRKAG